MGVFDFIRDAGAKVGIGKSTAELEAEEKARGIEAMKANAERMQRESDARAKEIAEAKKAEAEAEAAAKAKADADAKARLAAAKRRRRRAEAKERFSEKRRSAQLEDYVSKLGLQADDLEIRYDDGIAYITGEVADEETREKIILAVGNAEGVAKVDEEITVVAESAAAVFHTVVSGDTLWAIADKVYGDGNRYPEIFEANKPMLTDPDLIFPGQVLRCPK